MLANKFNEFILSTGVSCWNIVGFNGGIHCLFVFETLTLIKSVDKLLFLLVVMV